MTDPLNTFILEKNRTQYSHLPFIFIPFFCLMALIMIMMALQKYLPAQLIQMVLSLAGVGYMLLVFTLPMRMKKDKTACHRSLVFRDGKILLFDTRDNHNRWPVAEADLDNDPAHAGKFFYNISSRYFSDKYSMPLISIQFANGKLIHVGTNDSTLMWTGDVPLVKKPDFLLPSDKWTTLASRLNLSQID